MAKKPLVVPPGYRLVFRPYFIHPVTKKPVYPRNGKVFPLIVKVDGKR
jgi:hypothetical protein